jgi:hypothetical protein
MFVQNLDRPSGTSLPAVWVMDFGIDGTCNLQLVLLNRNGNGGVLVTL